MFFIFIILWILAGILFATDYKNETTRWLAFVAFIGGCGGLSRTITETVLPYLIMEHLSNHFFNILLFWIHIIASLICQNGLPYAFLMYSIVYSGSFNGKIIRLLTYILLIPPIYMILTAKMPTIEHPDNHWNFIGYLVWVMPYIVGGSTLLMYSYFKEKNKLVKKSRFYTNILVIPPLLFQLIANYMMGYWGIQNIWRFNVVFVFLAFTGFVIIAVKQGALGIRVKIEKHQFDRTRKALSSGTAILHHTIKNEIAKISLCTEIIRISNRIADPLVNEQLQMISRSTEHLLAMVAKIQKHLDELVLEEKAENLNRIMDQALEFTWQYIASQNIRIVKDYACIVKMQCDKVLLIEVVSNLIRNAVEAIVAAKRSNGELCIQLFQNKRYTIVNIKDNGIGIAKDHLPYVLDPFFSTKNCTRNFGLGLSYCHNFMQKCEGTLEIETEENKGTTISLIFPGKKVLTSEALPQQEAVYGKN